DWQSRLAIRTGRRLALRHTLKLTRRRRTTRQEDVSIIEPHIVAGIDVAISSCRANHVGAGRRASIANGR
ncbi:MAG: hypothetical protein KDK91_13525, partial [Gammaproteobacteria bacterium]|nr:hypothetical protein [Gammaproteobacteria bacterium]